MEFGVYVTSGSWGMDNVTIGQVSLFELYFIIFYPEVTHVLYYLYCKQQKGGGLGMKLHVDCISSFEVNWNKQHVVRQS